MRSSRRGAPALLLFPNLRSLPRSMEVGPRARRTAAGARAAFPFLKERKSPEKRQLKARSRTGDARLHETPCILRFRRPRLRSAMSALRRHRPSVAQGCADKPLSCRMMHILVGEDGRLGDGAVRGSNDESLWHL